MPVFHRRHWGPTAVLATALFLYLFAGLSLVGLEGQDGRAVARVNANLPAALRKQMLPQAEPLQFKQVAPTDAVALNAAVPLSTAPNPVARAFASMARTEADRVRALQCLTAAVYYEAAIEPLEGQRAVAQVVLNRVRHPAYPNSVCGVVWQGSERSTGCQFTFTCDGSLARAPSADGWARASRVAQAALAGYVHATVGHATHYHTNWVVPYWSSSLEKVANVGTHIFYRWSNGWGKPSAFRNGHSGVEPVVSMTARKRTDPAALAAAGMTDALAAAAAADGETSASIDSFQRAVLRRYEPVTRNGVATTLAAQTRSGETVAKSHLWALTGDGSSGSQAPLGKKAEASPAKPACLEGVKKAAPAGESGADALTC
ncbi:MAG TPA: cell wall hydrolase [Allosphingosinicella sp.]|nr:cell wall hydrolase [Allosphingosinicella sp.]